MGIRKPTRYTTVLLSFPLPNNYHKQKQFGEKVSKAAFHPMCFRMSRPHPMQSKVVLFCPNNQNDGFEKTAHNETAQGLKTKPLKKSPWVGFGVEK